MQSSTVVLPVRAGSLIHERHPEDAVFWARSGNRVANRNLAIFIPSLLLAFAIWMMFSAVAVSLPQVGFPFSTGQLFGLTALAVASLHIAYPLVVPLFGGRQRPC